MQNTERPTRRTLRAVRWVATTALLAVVLLVVGFLAWANTPMMGDRAAVLDVWRNPAVSVTDEGDSVVLKPTGEASGQGLVFVPGALVDPYAYLPTLAGAVERSGLTVVITKPTLNLAFFDQRPLSTFTAHAPELSSWLVGGHSLGGVRACQLADDPGVSGLILFGSYCANDLSRTSLPVLSLGGTRDGLSTPAKIRDASHLLPRTAAFVEVEGMNHAQFGAYGVQPGDNPATVDDATARAHVTDALVAFLAEQPGSRRPAQ